MNTKIKPSGSSDKPQMTIRYGLVRGGLAMVVSGAVFVICLRSDENRSAGQNDSNATVRDHFHPRTHSHRTAGSSSMVLKPAGAKKRQSAAESMWSALVAAQTLECPMEQSAALNRLMEDMTEEMAARLLKSLGEEDLENDAALRLFDHWATASPGEAAAWIFGKKTPETLQVFLNLAAARWATSDLNQAVAWARNLPEGDSRTEVLLSIGSEAVRSAPLEALRVGVELPPGMARAELIRRAVAEFAVKDQNGAMEWVRRIEDNELQQRATEQVLLASANQDPVKAATIALQELTQGVGQDRALVSIVQHWVQTDPEAASTWISEFPDGTLRRDAAENLVNLWANQDLLASGNWLLTLPHGGLRDGCVISYSRILERTNPEYAKLWLSSISTSIEK